MSIDRTSSRSHAAQDAQDAQAAELEAQTAQRRRALRAHQRARQYRNMMFRHAAKPASAHSSSRADQLQRRLNASGVTHRRILPHDDSGGSRQHGGQHAGQQHGNSRGNQHGGKRDGQEHGGEQQQSRQQQQQQRERQNRQGARAGGQHDSPGGSGARADGLPTIRIKAAQGRPGALRIGAPEDTSAASRSAVAQLQPLRELSAKLLNQPLLLDPAMRTAWTEQCFQVGQQQFRFLAQMAVTLDMLDARLLAGGLSSAPGESMESVRQDLLDTCVRLRKTPPRAPTDEDEETWNALLPLVVFSGRRPLNGTLLQRAKLRVQTLLNTMAQGRRLKTVADGGQLREASP